MKFYKLALWKRYFDTGFGVTNYLKYPLILFGWGTKDVNATITIALIWGLTCLPIGWWWLRFGMADAENEVTNRLNPFMKEVRRSLKIARLK